MKRARFVWIAVMVLCFDLRGQTPRAQTSNLRPNMKEAIWNANLPMVKRLLASGADPLKVDDQGPPPLLAPWEWAVVAGNNDALLLLLKDIPKIPTNDIQAGPRLITAAAMNNSLATRELVKR